MGFLDKCVDTAATDMNECCNSIKQNITKSGHRFPDFDFEPFFERFDDAS